MRRFSNTLILVYNLNQKFQVLTFESDTFTEVIHILKVQVKMTSYVYL